MLRDKERFPKFYKAYLLAFDKMLKRIKDTGKEIEWQTAEEVMDWWIYGSDKIESNPDQTVMFE